MITFVSMLCLLASSAYAWHDVKFNVNLVTQNLPDAGSNQILKITAIDENNNAIQMVIKNENGQLCQPGMKDSISYHEKIYQPFGKQVVTASVCLGEEKVVKPGWKPQSIEINGARFELNADLAPGTCTPLINAAPEPLNVQQ